MKKVVQVSLAGRAFQVEEAGHEALMHYLDSAEKSLSSNPDKAEIMEDIETAIAEKCDDVLSKAKNVVGAKDVEDILQKIGPVDAENEADDDDASSNAGQVQRKLYLLPKEGKISGVCAGTAAYFGVDVTIMRVIFVILLFLTNGFMLLIYIVMAVVMTPAKTAEEVAAAHGKPMTARDILDRMHVVEDRQDAIARTGQVINKIGRIVARLVSIAAGSVVAVASLGFVWLLWAILLGDLKLNEQLAVLNGWRQVVLSTTAYLIVVLPLVWIMGASWRVASAAGTDDATRVSSVKSTVFMAILWFLAIASFGAICTTYENNVRAYRDTHQGYIQIGNHQVCTSGSGICGDGYIVPCESVPNPRNASSEDCQ